MMFAGKGEGKLVFTHGRGDVGAANITNILDSPLAASRCGLLTDDPHDG